MAMAASNAFGGFLHTSPLSNLTSSTSHPPDPQAALSSNCVRDYFGPIVQSVADALHSRGPSTLPELIATIRHRCLRDWNEDRGRLVDRLNASVGMNNKFQMGSCSNRKDTPTNEIYYRGGRVTMNKARGPESAGYVTESSHVRAALIVLFQHSLVKVSNSGSSTRSQQPQQQHCTYTFLHERARLLPRYPRYIEHIRVIMNDAAAHIVECLLCVGRMRGEDLIHSTWEFQKQKTSNLVITQGDFDGSIDDDIDRKSLDDIVQGFERLVEAGYLECLRPKSTKTVSGDTSQMLHKERDCETMFGNKVEFSLKDDDDICGHQLKNTKKRRSLSLEKGDSKSQKLMGNISEDSRHHFHPVVLSLLSTKRKLIPHGSVYRVNTAMFHASLCAEVLMRFVSEIYPDESEKKQPSTNTKIEQINGTKYIGAVVKAALIHTARQEHGPEEEIGGIDESEEARHNRMAEWEIFSPQDIIPFLPTDVTNAMRSQVGGLNQNLSNLLVGMSHLQHPCRILVEIEEALGHPLGGKFEICTRQLLQHLRDRILHRFLTTHHGLVAARIVSILQTKGHCESDAIAEDAMVPTKEAREVLHRLHRDSYIDLADMHVTKTHNTGTAIFLWNVLPSRLFKTVIKNICTATLNLRLRRQHEVEVGKDWMNRANSAGEENTHDDDTKKYNAFCKGLERLDCACLQLDETLMVLKDF